MTMYRPRNDDDGLGLIELIVAIVVSGIVLIAIASMFINSWRTQEQVASVTEATNRGQVIGSAIERAMRNALWFDVPAVYGGEVLVVSTSLEGTLKCQGFRFTAGGAPEYGAAQLSMAEVSLSGDSTNWPEWNTGVAKQGTTPYFRKTVDGTLAYTFQIETDAAPVEFSSDIAPRSTQAAGSDGCW
ncbi:hypothetical protein B1729_18990 [Microbacterium sp. B35-04]|uniref:PilW family protein n=1 Tax=Microbacterium sp. B35-04 TaxID=1961716 RepID=UPI0013CF544F|nr:prepilin-type N-terminal cleavage/methylation domain-containing protein [Microbacterium sp. B35-04]KAF2411685.1 hypothetical protein B1729_18990 [Microbacterium sp. B35-04]